MASKMNVNSPEFEARMAELMAYASESNEGLRALAAAIAPPISMEIKRREITSLLLTKHKLPPGEPAKYQMRPKLKAYWISRNGDAVESGILEEEVEFPLHRIHAMPMIDVGVLKHGNVGTIVDLQQAAAEEIRRAIDKRTLTVMSAAVPVDRVVVCPGGTLTEAVMNQAVSLIEDQELRVKTILLRGKRMSDLKGWSLDPQTDRELQEKGFLKIYNGADLVGSSQMDENEILLLPDEEVGKFAIRQDLATDTINEPKRFRTGWLAWMEAAHGITRPDLLAKIVITL